MRQIAGLQFIISKPDRYKIAALQFSFSRAAAARGIGLAKAPPRPLQLQPLQRAQTVSHFLAIRFRDPVDVPATAMGDPNLVELLPALSNCTRSEERLVGKEFVSTFKSRWSP